MPGIYAAERSRSQTVTRPVPKKNGLIGCPSLAANYLAGPHYPMQSLCGLVPRRQGVPRVGILHAVFCCKDSCTHNMHRLFNKSFSIATTRYRGFPFYLGCKCFASCLRLPSKPGGKSFDWLYTRLAANPLSAAHFAHHPPTPRRCIPAGPPPFHPRCPLS
ncbi:hypothetical protein LZ31DRAFT_148489 [Colletotrichum somersetense]|nr:hypothetical protein LZ31DRAFT_148489 [Colletotrichum somersetense]